MIPALDSSTPRWRLLLVAATGVLALGPTSHAAAPKPAPKPATAAQLPKAAPLPADKAVSGHAPFEMGECSTCHQKDDPKAPGPLQGPVRQLCAGCHEMLDATLGSARHKHAAAVESCVGCHNPHNAPAAHLLRSEPPQLCVACHEEIGAKMTAGVAHDPVSDGASCLGCHDPHASEIDDLLLAAPFDLCVKCHGKGDVKDREGVALTNFTTLLETNKHHHGPVEEKDCSSCHEPHGSANFRLLVDPYPAAFYAGWSADAYALCFTCHDSEAFTQERTTTATSFRDGDRNLHFLHVNKAKRGRTCRACHEVHASPQAFQIRASVPYGSKGWRLHLNFEERPSGGQCSKTCHVTKTYDNGRKGK